MTDIQIETQYSTGASRQAIERALVAAGKDLSYLRPEDLALLEDFHTMGRIATAQLADLAEITPGDEVLDAGTGIGGTARYLARRSRCHVVAVDLTEEYCQTARWLNQLAGLDDLITVRQADVTDLPFQDATFTVMFSQHVQMNVADTAARDPGPRTSGLRRAAIRSARRRTHEIEDRHHRRRLCIDNAGKARHAPSARRESARATSREGHQLGNRRL